MLLKIILGALCVTILFGGITSYYCFRALYTEDVALLQKVRPFMVVTAGGWLVTLLAALGWVATRLL